MKEWDEIYRDLLAGQNAIAEAIATAKTLHERDTRFMNEIKSESDEWRRRALADEIRIAELEAQLTAQAYSVAPSKRDDRAG